MAAQPTALAPMTTLLTHDADLPLFWISSEGGALDGCSEWDGLVYDGLFCRHHPPLNFSSEHAHLFGHHVADVRGGTGVSHTVDAEERMAPSHSLFDEIHSSTSLFSGECVNSVDETLNLVVGCFGMNSVAEVEHMGTACRCLE